MSKLTRRQFLRVSALASAGAVLAACGGKKATEVATQAPVAADTKAPVVQPTATPAGPARPTTWPLTDVPRNHTLVYSYGIPTAGVFNAYTSGWNHQTGSTLLNEPAAFYAVHADKEILWLAESYQRSADAKEWTITFRKGIKWSDGTAFTAKDAAWGMEVLKRVAGVKTPGSFPKELDKTEAIDDVTLKVTLNQTDYRFFFKDLTHRFDLGDDDVFVAPQMFTGVADADMVAFKVYDQAKGWPISTGPYGVGVSNDQLTNFDIRPTWWAADTGFVDHYPDVWRLQSIPYTSDTLGAQQLINKEVDQTLDLRPLVVANIIAQADYLKTWTGRKPPYGYLDWWPISVQFCTAKPPFDNPKVRWAVAYALDQQKVVDIAWGGAGTVAMGPYPNFPKLVKFMDGIKDLTDQYNVLEYNLDKSAALMTEAGFTKDKDGFWVDADGKQPDSDLYAATPLFGDLAPIVAEQLRAGGFNSQHKVPPDVWAAKVDGRASMFLFGHGGSTIDPYDTFNLYTAKPPEMGQQSWGNITRWQNADFIAITEQMNNTAMDDPKMVDLFRQGMTLYYQNLPDCPLVQWYHRIPLNTWYWDNWPDETNPYMNAAIWHLTGFQVVYGLKATNKA